MGNITLVVFSLLIFCNAQGVKVCVPIMSVTDIFTMKLC
jgi:hypothetical protein